MLRRVLQAIQDSDGTMDLRALSRELEVEPSALEGMIQHWVAKGRLVDASHEASESSECISCAPTCGRDGPCPFIIAAPRVVSVATQADDDV
jgi:hypothetical protein